MTNARHKLNAANIRGALIVAGLIATAMQSWTIFVVIFTMLLVTALVGGDIRLRKRTR